MDSRRAAPTLGIVSSVVVVLVLLLPYGLLDEAGSVATYYGIGAVTPWFAGLLALVAVIVFAAGREERTDPVLAAGLGLGLGLGILAVSVIWALTVPGDVPLQLTTSRPLVGSLETGDVLLYHRWILALVSIGPPVAAGWYARALELY